MSQELEGRPVPYLSAPVVRTALRAAPRLAHLPSFPKPRVPALSLCVTSCVTNGEGRRRAVSRPRAQPHALLPDHCAASWALQPVALARPSCDLNNR